MASIKLGLCGYLLFAIGGTDPAIGADELLPTPPASQPAKAMSTSAPFTGADSCENESAVAINDMELVLPLPKPTVTLTIAAQQGAGILPASNTSADVPEHWQRVDLEEIALAVRFVLPGQNGVAPGIVPGVIVEIAVDGESWPQHFSVEVLNGQHEAKASIPCPTVGKHYVKARYRAGNVWSEWSQPVRFEVVPPPQPTIVAVGDCKTLLSPVTGGLAEINSSELHVRLGMNQTAAELDYVAFLDGEPLKSEGECKDCERQIPCKCDLHFSLKGHVPPGVYPLTLVSVAPNGVNSEPSKPVMIRWNPNENLPWHTDGYISRMSQLPLCDPCKEDVDTGGESPTMFTTLAMIMKALCGTLPAPECGTTDCKLALNAFDHTANVRQISSEQDDSGGNDKPSTICTAAEYRFHNPAFFPRRGFGQRGEVHDRDGVLIYEGMRFSCNKNGEYEVEFVAEAPSVPVDIRLQLQVRRTGDSHNWYTITLPPIHLTAGIDDLNRPRQQRIKQTGYASAIEALNLHEATATDCLEMRRAGTVRFGFGAEQYREANG